MDKGLLAFIRRATLLPAFAASACGLLALLNSCGGGGGSSVVGDLNTDLVITRDTVIPSELRAKNLTINDGVTVSSPGDLRIQTAGGITLNGKISPGGGLTLIDAGGLDYGANGQLNPANGNVIIVSDASRIPTAAGMETEFAKDLEFNGVASRASSAHRQGGPVINLVPTAFGPNAHGNVIWLDVAADVKIGKPGGGFVQVMPPGADGADGTDACVPVGKPGERGGSVHIHADSIELNGLVTVTLGAGGKGGNAITKQGATCCPATSTGGKGGDKGSFSLDGDDGVNNNGSVVVNYSPAGDGGTATATAKDYSTTAGCPAPAGCDATATAGDGGQGPKSQHANGNTSGAGNVSINGARAGSGGPATATAGAGGLSTCCRSGTGGRGGIAVAKAGKGGDSIATQGSGFLIGNGFLGGNGGDAAAIGKHAGDGASCCPDKAGGNGGKGGDATANNGAGGTGTNGNGTVGATSGHAGDGGDGGDGNGPGTGGGKGVGSPNPPVTDGVAGVGGDPCPGGCTQEQEPDDTLSQATQIPSINNPGDTSCGQGNLSSTADKDHFVEGQSGGVDQITINTAPAGGMDMFRQVGNQAPQTMHVTAGTTLIFTVPGPTSVVYIGFFNATGNYQFTLKNISSSRKK